MNYRCEGCKREWDYPVETCIFCRGTVTKSISNEYIVEEAIEVSVATEDHPVTPYHVMLLKDPEGLRRFKKSFERPRIGDKVLADALEPSGRDIIGIVGTGITGRGIAEVALRTGHPVILIGRSRTSLENALNWLSRSLSKSMSSEEAQIAISKIIATTDFEPLAHSDFIIESVVENIAIKRDIFRKLDSICNCKVVLASNTSSLKISEISGGLTHPERVVGLHFFNPITRMRLIEIIKTENTSDDVLKRCAKLAARLNKESVIVVDSPGFIVNRLIFAMINEACHALEEGIAGVKDIDKAMKLGANYPMGPFELADLIGLDLTLEILQNLHATSDSTKFQPSQVLKDLVERGCLGKKNRKGFYSY
jgi:3-hydroxybutyryl-CoA dehydrogenase